MLKKEMELEFINSFGLEDYLWKILKDEEIEENYKSKIVDFLKEYIGKDLYAAEYIRADRVLVLNVETGNDFVMDSIDLCEVKFEATTTKQKIQMAFAGQISEDELMKHLHSRSDEQIVQDLKEGNTLDGLLNTRDCLEDYLLSDGDEATKESARKALEYLYKAIKLRCSELISSEKKLKELLCN
jgi:hypothetical protein